jgi:hypothetical protein
MDLNRRIRDVIFHNNYYLLEVGARDPGSWQEIPTMKNGPIGA